MMLEVGYCILYTVSWILDTGYWIRILLGFLLLICQVLLERTVTDKSARIYYGSGSSEASIADEECSVISKISNFVVPSCFIC